MTDRKITKHTIICRIPKDVRKLIYAFAVFNSAITPYLYGYFSFDVKKVSGNDVVVVVVVVE